MRFTKLAKCLLPGLLILGCFGCSWNVSKTAPDESLSRRTDQRDEARGVWISSSYFGKDREKAITKIKDALDKFAVLGIDDIFCFEALEEQHENGWDFLECFLGEAHSRGMKVHPCFCPCHIYSSYREKIVKEHPEWLIKNMKEHSPALNIALPEARKFAIGRLSEVLKYDVDGVHLDGIRFQTGQGFSYDAATCRAFKEKYGKGPLELRWHNCGSVLWCEWIRWNASHVTGLVGEIKEAIRKSGKDIPLSAAVFPDCESAKILIGQDWLRWAEDGLIDILCPMIYTNNHEAFEKYTRRAVEAAKGKCRVYPGIEIVIERSENTPQGLAEQVKIARHEGADGIVFFYGGTLLEKRFFDKLKSGVFKEE